MLSMKTLESAPAQMRAPNVVKPGMMTKTPPTISIRPAKDEYMEELPMNVHSKPIGEVSPIGSMSLDNDGAENCSGKSLTMPYEIIALPSANRMYNLNHSRPRS